VLFRCESQGKTDIVADGWLIRRQDGKAFPTIDRPGRGGRFQRDPWWAGARQRYSEQEVGVVLSTGNADVPAGTLRRLACARLQQRYPRRLGGRPSWDRAA
jgi:hypothetical protein